MSSSIKRNMEPIFKGSLLEDDGYQVSTCCLRSLRFKKNKGNMVGKCFDNYFWYSPGCRADPGTCFTWLTAASWGMNEAMMKATVYNMPMAIAVARAYANWASMPLVHDMVLYWWVPDSTFLRPALMKVIGFAFSEESSGVTTRSPLTAKKGMPVETASLGCSLFPVLFFSIIFSRVAFLGTR